MLYNTLRAVKNNKILRQFNILNVSVSFDQFSAIFGFTRNFEAGRKISIVGIFIAPARAPKRNKSSGKCIVCFEDIVRACGEHHQRLCQGSLCQSF